MKNSDDQKVFEYKLVNYCSAVLGEIKPAATVALNFKESYFLDNYLEETIIKIYPLAVERDRIIWFIYNPKLLMTVINKPENLFILKNLGYDTNHIEACLKELKYRFTNEMIKREGFPHEIGIFLGYPLEDIIGFVLNKGKNHLYTGQWKVYNDTKETRMMFKYYQRFKYLCNHYLDEGLDLKQIIPSK